MNFILNEFDIVYLKYNGIYSDSNRFRINENRLILLLLFLEKNRYLSIMKLKSYPNKALNNDFFIQITNILFMIFFDFTTTYLNF